MALASIFFLRWTCDIQKYLQLNRGSPGLASFVVVRASADNCGRGVRPSALTFFFCFVSRQPTRGAIEGEAGDTPGPLDEPLSAHSVM